MSKLVRRDGAKRKLGKEDHARACSQCCRRGRRQVPQACSQCQRRSRRMRRKSHRENEGEEEEEEEEKGEEEEDPRRVCQMSSPQLPCVTSKVLATR